MTCLSVLYGMAIGVILLIAFGAILHPKVPTGVFGTLILGGIVAGKLASIERYGETPNWHVLLTIAEALLALYMATKWLRSRP